MPIITNILNTYNMFDNVLKNFIISLPLNDINVIFSILYQMNNAESKSLSD